MKLLSTFLRVILLLTLFNFGLFAAPADKTQTFTKTQKNGKVINYTLNGDEFISWLSSSDGYTLFENKSGEIVYAMIDESGKLKKSNIIAADPQYRSADDILFLSSIKKGLFYNSSQLDVFKKNREERYSINKIEMHKTVSNPNFLVILVNFSDLTFSSSNAITMANQIADSNYTANGATGSVKDYYYDNSMGALNANFVVVGPYTLSGTQAYYGAETTDGSHDIRPREMIAEACSLANQDINYADFDNDSDGNVDMIHVVYAGRGQHNGGGTDAIWPHSWAIYPSQSFDGVDVYKYSCSNELRTISQIDGIGTICHEMGHVLGLPDFYDTDYSGTGGQSVVLESWDLMSSGNYNNSAKTPPYLSALEREMLGWLDPIILISDSTPCTLPAISDSNKAYKVNLNSNEFFIFEHRNQTKWDAYTAAKGMLVFHGDNLLIDQWINSRINQININPNDRGFFIVPAYGDSTNNASSSTTFPGTQNITSFIGSKLKNYSPTGKALTSITYDQDSILHFNYFNSTPTITILPLTNSSSTSVTLNGIVSGNGITSMGFEYRQLGTSNFTQQSSTTNPLQVTIINLSPNTSYEYRIFLVSAIGTSYSETQSFITDCGLTLTPPLTEGFELALNCWDNLSSDTDNFTVVQSGTLPTCTPNGGTNMLRYNSYNISSNSWTALLSPKILFPNYFYNIKFNIFRTSGTYSKSDEGIEIYINSSKSFNGARKIGFISNFSQTQPIMTTNGWYEYSCNVSPEAVGETYIILKAISKNGYNIYLDDFSIEVAQFVAPIIRTDSITNITHNSVTINNSFFPGTETIIGTGVEYKNSFSNWDTIHTTNTTSPFVTTITSLAQNSLYFFKPYIETLSGRTYTNTYDSVWTSQLRPTILVTDTAIFNTPSTIVLYGSYEQGSYPVLTSGFQFKPNTLSTWTTLTHSVNYSPLYDTVHNLVSNTTYQYRTFITNYMSTVYGETKTFTTQSQPITLGQVISHQPELLSDSIIMRGELIHTGNTTRNLEIGFVYSSSPNPEINQANTTKKIQPYSPSLREFAYKITNPCYEYNSFYYRAYIKNDEGIFYGDTINVSCLSIKPINNNPIKIQLYPNPTSSTSKIEIDNVNGKVKITITDIRGRIIETMDLIANNRIEATIDLNNNSKGIYFINIITDNAKIAERLIIK